MDQKKPIIWIGSSKKDFMSFPHDIRREMGHALYIAQKGGKHRDAKPLKGFGGGSVLEIVDSDGSGHVSNSLHRANGRCCLCTACFPEEVKDGDKNSETRDRFNRTTIKTDPKKI